MNINKESQLALVRAEVGRSAKVLLILGAVLAVVGLVTLVSNEMYGAAADQNAGRAVAAVFLVIGGFFLWMVQARLAPGKSRLLIALQEKPQEVAWFYRQDVLINGSIAAASCNIIVCMRDGGTNVVTVPNRRAEALLSAIRGLVPHATEGFTPELAARYKRDPRSLRAA